MSKATLRRRRSRWSTGDVAADFPMREAKVETCCVQVDKPRGMLGGDILPEKHVFLLQKRDSIFFGSKAGYAVVWTSRPW